MTKPSLKLAYVLVLLAAAASSSRIKAAEQSPPSTLAIARSFQDGGGYVWADGPGTPCEIVHAGETILRAQEKGTYCSGFTFAVAMQAAQERGLLAAKTTDEVRRFQKEWYGSVEEAAERQCALAVDRLGVGVEVKRLQHARPGDFVQLWRTNKSGHSVVLVELLHEGDQIIGIRYRSSQKSTDGIGERSEYFADAPGRNGQLDRDRVYIARLFDSSR